ncbi:uncharacterized protein LOC143050743 [Mytilus galloprovincialis]|uniref:uncharacterized protein LOC143050743 n=1 Tax=Mytilus galloprovincialis TaxID=29158 RepID=UPI003F7BE4E0
MVIKAESAPSKTILRTIWPVPDSLAGIEDGINPTPSPTGATGQNPTPSPTGIIQLSPTPSPTSPDPIPSPSTTTELVPTPSPTGDPGLQPTPSSLDNIGLNPTPSPTKIGLTPTPSPFTTIVSNGAPKSTESRSAKVTLPSVTFSTTAQNGAEKAEPLNLCLVFYCLTLHECSKSKVTLEVDKAAEGGIIYIQGQGSACLQTTTSISRHYEFYFEICNITYDTVFRVIVQKYPTIQTGYDKVIPVTCLADLSEIELIEEVLPKKDDDVGVNITTKPVANLRVYTSSKNDISGGGVVNLNASIAMTITLADDFTDTYDIKAIECTAAMINIIENGCAVDKELFPNFQHASDGKLTSNFQAFQPTDLTGKEEVDVAFSCRLSVCKGKCDNTVCDKNVGHGRKRRDTKDNEIDEITCGTSIKVANHQKHHSLQESPVEPNTICVETLPAYFGLTIAGILFCLSWILSGYLLRQHLVDNSENKRMGVARSVGRRLTSMLNLPTGYDLKESKGFVSIPSSTDSTPPQRRKSVTATKIEMRPED